MKKHNILVARLCLLISTAAGAQALKGSYFLDSSLNRHELNPAFAPRANYVQLLAVGNLGAGFGTNIDMPSLLYPQDGRLLTFLHPDVSMAQFDKAFPKHPHLDADVRTTILGFGKYTKNKAFWTFDLDVRANVDTDLPGDLFRFLKQGTGSEGGSYNIGNINAYAMAGVQATLGYSRDIFDGFRVGIKARAIAPVGYGALNLENVRLTTSEDMWKLTTEGYAHIAAQGLEIDLPKGELMPSVNFDKQKAIDAKVLAGFGCSFDLGFEYRFEKGTRLDGLTVSAAVTDLGTIRYKKNAVKSFTSSGSVEWTGLDNVTLDNYTEAEAYLNNFLEEAQAKLINLSEMENKGGFSRSTMPTFNAGVEVPLLTKAMTVGLLYSVRKSHSYARQEMTLSYNLTPCKWFALGLNYSFLNTARTMGCIFELTPRVGPAFYIGCDYLPIEWAKADFIPYVGHLPTAYRLNLNFGLALQTGGKTTKKPKIKK